MSDQAAPNLNTRPAFDADQIALHRRMRFNPLRMHSPENLSMALDQFDIGILRFGAQLWDAMIRRDDTLSFVVPQFENSIAGKPWGVFKRKNADPVEAARHAAALEYFYSNLSAVNAFDRNERGDRHLLLKQMSSAFGFRYALHHFVWKPQPDKMIQVEDAAPVPALSAELEFVPLWYFENTTGTMRFLPFGGFGATGLPMDFNGEWMCTTGPGMMFAASISYTFKRLAFQDWTIFNERYAQQKVLAQTPESRDSEQGQSMAQIVADFNGDMGIVLYNSQPGDKPPISLLGPEGSVSVDIFEKFLDRQDRKMTVMFRGSDLRNMSREKDVTGVSAQSAETEAMELAHCANIASSCRTFIDRNVIRFAFGEGVEPLAYFGLPDMDDDDAQQLRESAGFLADRGVLVEAATVAERLGITLTEDKEDALQPASGGLGDEDSDADLVDEEAGARPDKTENAARLMRLVKEALRTHNSGFNTNENRDELGRWVADSSAGVIHPDEARARLKAGINLTDALGNPARLDSNILEHWDAEGHTQEEQDRRLRRLPDIIKAVETPHEVWQGDKQTAHIRMFTDEKSKRRFAAGFIMENGRARTFFHFDRTKEVQKLRKGTRLYVRK